MNEVNEIVVLTLCICPGCAFMPPFMAKEDILTKLKFVARLPRLTDKKKLLKK